MSDPGARDFEIGLVTFGDRGHDPETGRALPPETRLAHLLEEVELADQVGLDVFGVGEHHRPDYTVSAPAVVLAAMAARTRRIRLTSAVTVLSSDDPVRVFQQFATLDLLSHGRAEIMAGRGSFVESFPLFGYALHDYDALFEEKLELLLRLREHPTVDWQGRFRPALEHAGVHPRPLQRPLPVWIAVGGTPASAVRAGRLGLDMVLAIIGGQPERFAPFGALHRDAARRAGHAPPRLAVNTHAFVAPTSQAAADTFFGPYAEVMSRIGRERGWPPMGRPQFEAMRGLRGALAVGDPTQVAEKVLFLHRTLGMERYLAQLTVGAVPHRELLRAIELLGSEVAPVVRRELGARAPHAHAVAPDATGPSESRGADAASPLDPAGASDPAGPGDPRDAPRAPAADTPSEA